MVVDYSIGVEEFNSEKDLELSAIKGQKCPEKIIILARY